MDVIELDKNMQLFIEKSMAFYLKNSDNVSEMDKGLHNRIIEHFKTKNKTKSYKTINAEINNLLEIKRKILNNSTIDANTKKQKEIEYDSKIHMLNWILDLIPKKDWKTYWKPYKKDGKKSKHNLL